MSKLDKCEYCGNDFKNLGAHLRHCKEKKAQELKTEKATETAQDENEGQDIQTPAEAQAEPTGKPQDEDRTRPPLKLNLDKLDFHEVQGDTEEEKLKRFMSNLPKWTVKKPQGIRGKLFNLLNGSKALKACIFVSEHGDAKICYVPYDPKREIMVNPKTGEIYETPIKGDVAFFHAEKFRPLVNSRDPRDIYDLPEHYALKLYNTGIQEAQLKGFEDLINHIKLTRYLAYGALALCALAIIAAVIMIKTNSTALEVAAQEMGNVTRMYGGV